MKLSYPRVSKTRVEKFLQFLVTFFLFFFYFPCYIEEKINQI